MKTSTILDQIDLGSIALPEFQRGYVWNRDQVRGFMDSLYKKHPVGSLLVWVTRTAGADSRGGSRGSQIGFCGVFQVCNPCDRLEDGHGIALKPRQGFSVFPWRGFSGQLLICSKMGQWKWRFNLWQVGNRAW